MERRRRIWVRILRWLAIILAGAAVGVAYLILSVVARGDLDLGVFVARLGAPVFWVALISIAGLPWLVLWSLAVFVSPARAAADGALVGCVLAVAVMALRLLLTALDQEKEVGDEATQALSGLGPRARSAIPALVRKARDGSPKIRLRAIRVLEGLGYPDRAVIDTFSDALNDPDPAVRRVANDFLRDIRYT